MQLAPHNVRVPYPLFAAGVVSSLGSDVRGDARSLDQRQKCSAFGKASLHAPRESLFQPLVANLCAHYGLLAPLLLTSPRRFTGGSDFVSAAELLRAARSRR